MAKQANILSFDDAKKYSTPGRAAHGSSRRGSARSAEMRAQRVDDARPARGFRGVKANEVPRSSRRSRRQDSFEPTRASLASAQAPRRASALPSWLEAENFLKPASSFAATGSSRSGIMSYDDFMAEEELEDNQGSASQNGKDQSKKKGLLARYSEARKKRTKEKADKQFTRQFGSDAPSSASAGPRAAVYKAEMGSSQKRATRMQDTGSMKAVRAEHRSKSAAKSGGFALPSFNFSLSGVAKWFFSSRLRITACTALACVVIACAFMYPAAKQYYTEMRSLQRVQAEYEAVVERNAQLAEQRDYLKSVEGIEQSAHDNYGWVNQGENAVLVYGLPQEDVLAETNLYINSGSVPAPTTWYSVLLDPFFGFS